MRKHFQKLPHVDGISRERLITGSFQLLLLTKYFECRSEVDTKSPTIWSKRCFITEKYTIKVYGLGMSRFLQMSLIYVLKKRVKVQDRTYPTTKRYMYMYHVDPLRVLSGKDHSANVICYTWTTATSQIHSKRPYIHQLSPGPGPPQKPRFLPVFQGLQL